MSIKKILAAAMTAGMMLSFIPMTSMADSTGWHQSDPGWRYYTLENGYVRDTWKKIDGKWYYFAYDGYMIANAENFEIDGKYYSFSASGECLNPSGKTKMSSGWNRFSSYGYDITSQYRPHIRYSWVYVGSDGELCKGWQSIGGKWYYFGKNNGIMFYGRKGEGLYHIDDAFYYFSESGEMLTGWINDGSYWLYASPSGKLYAKEWLYSGGKWYYFTPGGYMIHDSVNYEINGVYYSFDSNGACINPSGTTDLGTGMVKIADRSGNSFWYFIDEQGEYYTGWKKIDGFWYYFSKNGKAYKGSYSIDGKGYYFNKECQMLTGWIYEKNTDHSYWLYAGPDGAVYEERWLNQGGKWYYFTSWGMMVSDVENYLIDGKYYSFDSSGACKNPSGLSGKQTGWFKKADEYGYRHYETTPRWHYRWVYFDSNGEMYKDKWLNSAGKWYYFDEDGYMADNDRYYIESEDKMYDFDKNGVCLNPNNPRKSDFS